MVTKKKSKPGNPILEELAEQAAERYEWIDEQTSPLSPPLSASAKKEKFKQELIALLDEEEESKRIEEGMLIIFTQLKINPLGKVCLDELAKSANQLLDDSFDLLDKLPAFIKNFKSQRTLNQAQDEPSSPLSLAQQLGISHNTLKTIYEIGNQLFIHKQYDEALNLFQAFVHLNNASYEAWVALGICFQQKEKWYHAINAYTMASLLSPAEILPYLYSCECFIALNNYEQAKGCLELAEYFKKKHRLTTHTDLQKKLHKQLQDK